MSPEQVACDVDAVQKWVTAEKRKIRNPYGNMNNTFVKGIYSFFDFLLPLVGLGTRLFIGGLLVFSGSGFSATNVSSARFFGHDLLGH